MRVCEAKVVCAYGQDMRGRGAGGRRHGSCACAILSPFPPVDSCYSVWPNAVISRFIYSVSTSVIFMKVIVEFLEPHPPKGF